MYYIVLGIQIASVVLLLLQAGFIFANWKTRLQGNLLLYVMVTLINNAGYLMQMISKTEEGYWIALRISYMGRVWIGFSLLIFIFGVCKVKIRKWIVAALASFSFLTFIAVCTTQYHQLYYTSMVFTTDGLFPYLKCGHGIWHTVYFVSLIAYIVVGLSVMIYKTVNTKGKYEKKRMLFILAAISANSIFFLMEVFGGIPGYDDAEIGYMISTHIMSYAIFRMKLLDTLQYAKDYVIDELAEGVIAVNVDGGIEYVNKRAAIIYPEMSETKDKQEIERILNQIQDAVDHKQPLNIRGRIYSPEAERLDNQGIDSGKLYVLVDSTEHYRYMEELKEQKQLAEDANASKSAFLSVVSHEIRTPMNAVVGMTELLLRDKESLTDKQEKYLRNIKNSGAALVMIVNDILDQSKIEAGKMEIIEDAYELRPMLEDVRMIIENRIGESDIRLEYQIEEGIPELLIGDSLRIRQILINLMNNAVKFTQKGFIRLSIQRVSGNKTEDGQEKLLLRFGVKDSGQGIKPEDLSKLGQAFTQVDTKKNHRKEGTGLGLSISRDFISMMGGQLEVTSTYGEGSEFFFSIYQGIAESIKQDGAPVRAQAWQDSLEFIAREARVLIVDDTKLNRLIAKEMLEPVQMTVDEAASAKEAIEKVKDASYDIIFMDYMMPDMNGVEATKVLRSMGCKSVIIALTGDTSEPARELFISCGMNDYTEKPVAQKKLMQLLLKYLPEEKIHAK